MRTLSAVLFLLVAIALAAPDSFADWIRPIYLEDQSTPAQDNSTLNDGNLELLKRQNNGNCYTNYYACSTIAAFSASAPANSPADGISDGEGVPDESAGDPSGRIGSSEPGCFVSSDIGA